MSYLANTLTALSLVCGFTSIIFSLEAQFTLASWAIIFSVVFDGLDGQIARLNRSSSDFGKEFDSLSDAVCFGVAPAVLGYVFIYRDFHLAAVFALLAYLACSVIRLARYNIIPKGKAENFFYGLPTTASGGALASFILIFRRGGESIIPRALPYVFIVLVLVLAFLMVSRIKYPNLDAIKEYLGRRTVFVALFLFTILGLAAYAHKAGVTLSLVFLIYLIFSPFIIKKIV